MIYLFIAIFVIALMLYVALCVANRELKWAGDQLRWENDRFGLIFEIFSEARVVTSIPNHDYFSPGPGGNVMFQSSPTTPPIMLNYQTLAEMVLLTVQQDNGRRLATSALRQKLNLMAVWESEHPKPDPPMYFNRRLTELWHPWRGNQGRSELKTHPESQSSDPIDVAELASHKDARRIHRYIVNKAQYPPPDRPAALDQHSDT